MTTYWQIIYVVSTNFSESSLQATYGHLLVQASYSQFNQFSNSDHTGLASFDEQLKYCREFSFQYNGLLYCRALARREAYTVLFVRKGSHFAHDTSRKLILKECTICLSTGIQIRLMWYSSGRAVISDTLSKSNTGLGHLAARVLGDNPP